jgi:hypothetical protein
MNALDAPGLPPRRGGGCLRSALALLVLLGGVLAGWTWVSLHWAYSDGERAGVLQKFSRRGYVCKTEEGELALYLMPGVAPKIWEFSVRDRKVGEALDKAVGSWVQLHYTEHVGVPTSCFADTRYFVDRVTLSSQSPYGYGAPQPGTPTTTPAPSPAPTTAPSPAPTPGTMPPATPPPPAGAASPPIY